MLNVNEMFYTLQGEGITAGRPALFIRLQGCNLTCDWCDTKFTWHKDHLEKGKKLSIDDLYSILRSEYPQANRIIWTGGEPLLQQKQILECIKGMAPKILRMHEIETNGTVRIDDELARRLALINISPKLKSSGAKVSSHQKQAFKQLARYNNTIWKFVVKSVRDIQEIVEDYEIAYDLKPMQIYLMGEGVTTASQLTKMLWIFEECKKYGWNYSPRLQVLAYNDERKR